MDTRSTHPAASRIFSELSAAHERGELQGARFSPSLRFHDRAFEREELESDPRYANLPPFHLDLDSCRTTGGEPFSVSQLKERLKRSQDTKEELRLRPGTISIRVGRETMGRKLLSLMLKSKTEGCNPGVSAQHVGPAEHVIERRNGMFAPMNALAEHCRHRLDIPRSLVDLLYLDEGDETQCTQLGGMHSLQVEGQIFLQSPSLYRFTLKEDRFPRVKIAQMILTADWGSGKQPLVFERLLSPIAMETVPGWEHIFWVGSVMPPAEAKGGAFQRPQFFEHGERHHAAFSVLIARQDRLCVPLRFFVAPTEEKLMRKMLNHPLEQGIVTPEVAQAGISILVRA